MSSKSFTQRVYRIVSTIPIGKVATYSQIAKMAGSPHAARAVGLAMKKNLNIKTIPCHRVVASDGSLCGYSAGEGVVTKQRLLEKEGVVFKKERVNLTLSQWRR